MSSRLTGDWDRAKATLKNAATRVAKATDKAVAQEAQDARKQIVQGIRKQAPGDKQFIPLSKLTIAMRKRSGFRGRKALIRTAALIGSVSVKRVGMGRYFIGVLRGASEPNGQSFANVADVMENGRTFVMRVTPKMRRLIMMAMREAGILRKRRSKKDRDAGVMAKRVIVVRIPPRPFVGPVMRKLQQNPSAVKARLRQRTAKLLGYSLGR